MSLPPDITDVKRECRLGEDLRQDPLVLALQIHLLCPQPLHQQRRFLTLVGSQLQSLRLLPQPRALASLLADDAIHLAQLGEYLLVVGSHGAKARLVTLPCVKRRRSRRLPLCSVALRMIIENRNFPPRC